MKYLFLPCLYITLLYFSRCWQKIPEERPSMDEVVKIMTKLSEFFSPHLEPIEYSLSMYIIHN